MESTHRRVSHMLNFVIRALTQNDNSIHPEYDLENILVAAERHVRMEHTLYLSPDRD